MPCGRSRRNWCHEATWGEGNMQFFDLFWVCLLLCLQVHFLKYISLYIAVFYCGDGLEQKLSNIAMSPSGGACLADFF